MPHDPGQRKHISLSITGPTSKLLLSEKETGIASKLNKPSPAHAVTLALKIEIFCPLSFLECKKLNPKETVWAHVVSGLCEVRGHLSALVKLAIRPLKET